MKTIAKMVGFVEGFIFALTAFLAAVCVGAAWFGVNFGAVNKSVRENSEI